MHGQKNIKNWKGNATLWLMCRRRQYSGIQVYIAENKMSSKVLERQRCSLNEVTSQLLPVWTSPKPRSPCTFKLRIPDHKSAVLPLGSSSSFL